MPDRVTARWKLDFDNMKDVVMPAAISTPNAIPASQSWVVRD